MRKEKQKIQSRLVAKWKNKEHPTELIATTSKQQAKEMIQSLTRRKRREKKRGILQWQSTFEPSLS